MSLDIEAIKKRMNAATPPPWRLGEQTYWDPNIVHSPPREPYEGTFVRIEDAEFIAHARLDVPALVREVERLRAAILEEREACARIAEGYNGYAYCGCTTDIPEMIRARGTQEKEAQ